MSLRRIIIIAGIFFVFGIIDTSVAQFYFCINDHLGNTRAVVDENAEVKEYYDYYPFGKIRRSQIADIPVATFKFSGKELDDENGLDWHYFGARYYDAEIGRFTSVDRFAEKYPGLTPYQYAANNPLFFIDANGDSLLLSGAQSDINSFSNFCNAKLGGFYNVTADNSGLLNATATGQQGPMTAEQQAFYDVLMGAASLNVGAVRIGLVNKSEKVIGGNYELQQIDMADILAIGNKGPFMTSASALGHEIAEQTFKQLFGLKNNTAMANMAHNFAGIAAENTISGAVRGREDFGRSHLYKVGSTLINGNSYPINSGNYYIHYQKSNNWGGVNLILDRNNIIQAVQ